MFRDATSWTQWTDLAERSGWRWQFAVNQERRSAEVHRLLAPTGRIELQGDKEAIQKQWCQEVRFEDVVNQLSDEPVVIHLHGLGRTRRSMRPMRRALARQFPKLEQREFGYASLVRSIDDHASALEKYLAWSVGSRPVIFVAHSLGNIVLRRLYYKIRERHGLWLPDNSSTPFRLMGHVMLGPPNQGSRIATRLSHIPGLPRIMGPSFMQLGPKWSTVVEGLESPPGEVLVIAGDVPSFRKLHPLLGSPNDGLVTVDETRLWSGQDVRVYPIPHTLFMMDKRAQQATMERVAAWIGEVENGS